MLSLNVNYVTKLVLQCNLLVTSFLFLDITMLKVVKFQGAEPRGYRFLFQVLQLQSFLMNIIVKRPFSLINILEIHFWECQNVLDIFQKVIFGPFKKVWHSQNRIGFP